MAIANENQGDVIISIGTVTIVDPASLVAIFKVNEITVATKTKSDLASTTYTVPSGKKFKIKTFGASYDTQGSPIFIRLEKQTSGAGAFAVLFRISLQVNGQDQSNFEMIFPGDGLLIGSATDVFKITYESALAKGSLWAGFTGNEY